MCVIGASCKDETSDPSPFSRESRAYNETYFSFMSTAISHLLLSSAGEVRDGANQGDRQREWAL
jgi:hypothetical protein